MDASGVYYGQAAFSITSSTPVVDPQACGDPESANLKRCSIRGCSQLLPKDSQTKMCSVCRSRHRIYATTKRAKRKLEKEAIASGVTPFTSLDHGEHINWFVPPNVADAVTPLDQNIQTGVQGTLLYSSSGSTTSAPVWNQNFDPQLFSGNSGALVSDSNLSSPRHPQLKPHQTSLTSELANALILPLSVNHNQAFQGANPLETPQEISSSSPHKTPVESNDEDTDEVTSSVEPARVSSAEDQGKTPSRLIEVPNAGIQYSGPPRFCSVKGCKIVIPASYEFKMCPSCRTRYRSYGNAKRAKWKAEREAYDREMANLQSIEDAKRRDKGLPPLAECPEEFLAWEQSIVDEQVPLPTSMASVPPPPRSQDPNDIALKDSTPLCESESGPFPFDNFPYRHTERGLSEASTSHPPARMCTVSHCHKILPGSYRYKRCEQHRLQNRRHSKLKRVREKFTKASGPEQGVTPVEIPFEMRSEATKRAAGEDGSSAASPIQHISTSLETESVISSLASCSNNSSADGEKGSKAKPEKRDKYSCISQDCHNLLIPSIRWRTCEDCRSIDRNKKLLVGVDAKQANEAGWVDVPDQMRTVRIELAVDSSSLETPTIDHNLDVQQSEVSSSKEANGDSEAAQVEQRRSSHELETASDGDGTTTAEEGLRSKSPSPTIIQPPTGTTFIDLQPNAPLIWEHSSAPVRAKEMDPFRAYVPKTSTPGIARTSTSEAEISVRAFTSPLRQQHQIEAPKTTTAGSNGGSIIALSTTLNNSRRVPSTSAENLSTAPPVKPVMTPTVPVSAPFVYKPKQVTRSALPQDSSSSKEGKPKGSSGSKGKGKPTAEGEAHHTSSAPSTTASGSQIPPRYMPYTYPPSYRPSYPYPFPYYLPPAYTPGPTSAPPKDATQASTSTSTTSQIPIPSYHYQYGYNPPHPALYGYPTQSGYAYIPPGFSLPASYGRPPGMPGPVIPNPYSYYGPSLGSVPVVSAPVLASAPTKSKPRPKTRPKPKPRDQYTFYHYTSEVANGQQAPRKRRKVDPDYLEKYEAQTKAISLSLAAGFARQTGAAEALLAQSDASTIATLPPVLPVTTLPDRAIVEPPATETDTTTAKLQESGTERHCANKLCERMLLEVSTGAMCDKCKVKLKKHRDKMKQKLKLVPRTSIVEMTTKRKNTQNEKGQI